MMTKCDNIISSLPDSVIEKISEEASRMAFDTLSNSESGRFEIWHEDPERRIDLTCRVFGIMSIEGDGYELPQEVIFSHVSVYVYLDAADPPISDIEAGTLTDIIKTNIEEYLIA